MRALGLSLMCIALFSIAGGHWAILQTVAWTQMIWDYSQQTGSVVTATEQTISGKYPCSLCKKVAEGRKAEEKAPATVKVDKKAEFFMSSVRELLKEPVSSDYSYITAPEALFAGRSQAPPVPVPISLLA